MRRKLKTRGIPAAQTASHFSPRRSLAKNRPHAREKPINAAATTPRVGSHGKTKNDQMTIAITPRLLNKVSGMERRTNAFEPADVAVSSTRPTPARSRLDCMTAVAIAIDKAAKSMLICAL